MGFSGIRLVAVLLGICHLLPAQAQAYNASEYVVIGRLMGRLVVGGLLLTRGLGLRASHIRMPMRPMATESRSAVLDSETHAYAAAETP